MFEQWDSEDARAYLGEVTERDENGKPIAGRFPMKDSNMDNKEQVINIGELIMCKPTENEEELTDISASIITDGFIEALWRKYSTDMYAASFLSPYTLDKFGRNVVDSEEINRFERWIKDAIDKAYGGNE